jgi:proteasome lid subunit RPN8/RPN11
MTNDQDRVLRVARAALDSIVAHARAAHPAECCGLLIGKASEITGAVPTRNIAADPNRFLIDPKDHIDGRREARRRGLEVLGFYHSHPQGPAAPSSVDQAEAAYPGHIWLIVSVATEPVDVRLFQFEGGRFLETSFVEAL